VVGNRFTGGTEAIQVSQEKRVPSREMHSNAGDRAKMCRKGAAFKRRRGVSAAWQGVVKHAAHSHSATGP
jgi:hypothetical protein